MDIIDIKAKKPEEIVKMFREGHPNIRDCSLSSFRGIMTHINHTRAYSAFLKEYGIPDTFSLWWELIKTRWPPLKKSFVYKKELSI